MKTQNILLTATWTLVALSPAAVAQTPKTAATPVEAAAGALPPAPVYDYTNPPAGIFDEEWVEIFMGQQKVGYGHQTFQRDGDHIIFREHDEFHLKRLNNVLTMSEDSTSEETLDGQIISFHNVSSEGDQPTVVDGKGVGKGFQITTKTGTYQPEAKQVEFPPGTVMGWGAQRMTRSKGLAPGTTYEFLSYDPTADAFAPLTTKVTIGAKEKLAIHGQEVEGARVAIHVASKSGLGGIDTVEWDDASFRSLKVTVPLGPMSMDMVAATKEQAMANYQPGDIFSASLLTLDRALPSGAKEVVFNLRRKDGQPLLPLPESAMEHGEVQPDGSVQLTLTRPELARKNAAAHPGPKLADPAPYLARNTYLDTSDPLVQKLANQAGGPPQTDPLASAWQLRDFVADYINKKDFNVGFGTASETAKNREGDCTEHAVLLAELGRARGLPTRTVSGLVYVPHYQGQDNVLGFHMWTQFYFDGRWQDFDAALTDGDEPYWRLGLVASDLNDGSMSDFTMEMARWMAELKITVTNVSGAAAN